LGLVRQGHRTGEATKKVAQNGRDKGVEGTVAQKAEAMAQIRGGN